MKDTQAIFDEVTEVLNLPDTSPRAAQALRSMMALVSKQRETRPAWTQQQIFDEATRVGAVPGKSAIGDCMLITPEQLEMLFRAHLREHPPTAAQQCIGKVAGITPDSAGIEIDLADAIPDWAGQGSQVIITALGETQE